MRKIFQRKTLKKITAFVFLFSAAMLAKAQGDKASVEVITTSGASIKTTVKKETAPGGAVYAIGLANTAKEPQNLKWVNVTVQAPVSIPNGTSYMIGSDEMLRREGNMLLQQTGKPIRNKDNNMYLLFRLNPTDYLLVGVVSWRTFLCKMYEEAGAVHIEGDGDNRLLKSGENLPFEKVVWLRGASWQDLLDSYADLIVKENKVAPPPAITWKGWATWDFYVQHFLSDDVVRNTKLIQEVPGVKANIIQIDGGWWKHRGDYFDVREDLPGGIKAITDVIHKNGFKAGLHFDGYRVAADADIVKQHPEYFIHTDDGKLLESGKDPVTKGALVYWDYSHPGAQQFITSAMANARTKWGVEYFKIDFMRNGLNTKGKSYLPVTNVERYRMGIEAMRKGIKDAYFLACSPNFGVNIGLIEASRTGPDIDPSYDAIKMRAAHNSGNYYFNRKIYNCDPDYLVLRNEKESSSRDGKKPSLTYEQAQMWAAYVSIYGNVRLESDELSLLPNAKKDLIGQTFAMPFFVKTIPLDLWDHFKTDDDAPRLFLSKGPDGQIVISLFNWAATDATFAVTGFKQTAELTAYHDDKKLSVRDGQVTLPLKGVQSVLFRYTGKESFDELRKELSLAVK